MGVFFNKVAGPQNYIFIKKRVQHRYFPEKLATFLRTICFTAAASAGLRFPTCNFVKNETPVKMFFCEFYEICKSIFWLNTPGWLLFVFIWKCWEAFQKISFIETLIPCTSAEFQPPDTERNYFTSSFQAFYTRTTSSHSKTLKS